MCWWTVVVQLERDETWQECAITLNSWLIRSASMKVLFFQSVAALWQL
jgi:hypothetical protein